MIDVVGFEQDAAPPIVPLGVTPTPSVVAIGVATPVTVDPAPPAPTPVAVDRQLPIEVVSDAAGLSIERRDRIAADDHLQSEIDALSTTTSGQISDFTGILEGEIGNAVDIARSELDAAKNTLQSTIDANAATAQALFDNANGAAAAAREAAQHLFDSTGAAEGEVLSFVGAMRAHVDLTLALRSAAALAATLIATQTIVQDARSAIVTTQQVGLAKIGDVGAAFSDFRTAQLEDNAATAAAISDLQTQAGDNSAAIQTEALARSTAIEALAGKGETIAAGFGAGDAAGEVNVFLSAVKSGDVADIAARGNAQALAGIQRIETTLADQSKAIASSSFALGALIAQNYAAFVQQIAAQATTDQAIVDSITTLQTNVTTNYATTAALNSTLSTAESYADHAVSTLQTTIEATYQPISGMSAYATTSALATTLTTAESYADGAVSSLSTSIAATYQPLAGMSNYATTSALSSQIAAAEAYADSAVAALQSTLAATITGNYNTLTGQITSLQTVVADLSKASATKTDFVGVALSGAGNASEVADFVAAMRQGKSLDEALRAGAVNAAGNIATQAAVADLKQSLASLSTTTFARFGDNLALIQAQATALADASKALASKEDTTAASLGGLPNEVGQFIAAMREGAAFDAAKRGTAQALAAVAQQTIAQTDATKALASYSMTVASQFGDSWAAIRVNASTLATVQGQLAAAYSVDLDVNGYATGFKLTNGGPGTSTFQIRADKFTVALPGYSAQPVMSVQNVNGVPTLAFNGNIIADGTLLNAGIGANAVSNSAGASSSGGSCSVNLPVRAGSRIAVFASFGGYAGGTDAIGLITLTVGGSSVATQTIAGINFGSSGSEGFAASGSAQQYLLIPSLLLYTFTAGSAGTLTIAMSAAGNGGTQRGPTSLVAMELSK